MTSIERTAYPRLPTRPPPHDIDRFYTATEDDLHFIQQHVRRTSNGNVYGQHHLNVLVLLKCFQRLGYFPTMAAIPAWIVALIREQLTLSETMVVFYQHRRTLYKHHRLIRQYLNVKPFDQEAHRLMVETANHAARLHNYPADIINVVLEVLTEKRFELPAFSTLSRSVHHIRHRVNEDLFVFIHKQLGEAWCHTMDDLIKVTKPQYDSLKYLPRRVSMKRFQEMLDQHDWLHTLGSVEHSLTSLSQIKLKQFAGEAKSLDASNMRDMAPSKRYALMACLLHDRQAHAKDHLVTMLIQTMQKIDHRAQDLLIQLREQNKSKTRALLTLLNEIASGITGQTQDTDAGRQLKTQLSQYGGATNVVTDCEQIAAYHENHHLRLMWSCFRSSRATLLRLLPILNIQSATQDDLLIKAQTFLLHHASSKRALLPLTLDVSFASMDWKRLILKKKKTKVYLVRRHFEVCVFWYLACALKSVDAWVCGSASYTDFRQHLLPLSECERQWPTYCETLSLPQNGKEAVLFLKKQLIEKADQVDKGYPESTTLVIDAKGNPMLKKRVTQVAPPSALRLEAEIKARMPQRHLMDVLVNTHHETGWADCFGPIGGSEPKMKNALEGYILTTFAYGTGMGPTQAAQHIKTPVSARMLSWIHRRHVNTAMQNKALVRIIDHYTKFDLVHLYGSGKSVAVDGTLCKIYQENLTAAYHVRYGTTGGIAYHYVSDCYIALFSTFISCGVWEAIEIIDGLLQNKSRFQPRIVHGDTQGQSTIVFAMTYLLGITLMPRIRNWKDRVFYRPDAKIHYQHIHSLFKENIDWCLIETHWQDMLQVTLSIQHGKISSSALLRRLGSYSKRNKLYQAFRELGCVVSTGFLLDYISDGVMQENITAQTNKAESYNGLTKWIAFGNPYAIIASNDPEDHEKAIKYTTIIADSLMLQNVIDISDVLKQLIEEGYPVQLEDAPHITPLLTGHFNRFGYYYINVNQPREDSTLKMTLPFAKNKS